MVAPQRRLRYPTAAGSSVRGRKEQRGAFAGALKRTAQRRRGVLRGQTFVALVVVPMLLMLGSVYLHTLVAGLKGERARLEEEKATAESEGERLDVRVTELSDPGRVRTVAKKSLQMQDPGGNDIATYGNDG
jgi:cell division protein FtsL